MTTLWEIPGMWTGQTVAVLARGPSMSKNVAEAFGVESNPVIAVSTTYQLAPWADMLFAHDLAWWQQHRDAEGFAGLRVCGQDGEIDALRVELPDERVTIAPGHVLELRNSGLMAIRIAAAAGASRILLAGFDPERGGRWDSPEARRYPGVAEGLAAIMADLRSRGVGVERV